jgi:hypothetical protein
MASSSSTLASMCSARTPWLLQLEEQELPDDEL